MSHTFEIPLHCEGARVRASQTRAEGGKEDHGEGWLIFVLHRRTKPRPRFRNEQRGYLDVRSDLAVPRCVLFM
jgi:hypothetical protein